ncbi:hypothetical protein [Methylomicrobium sp. Wu6]|uniref:hypothetical protein n=1 Tax=Methylomicrobium sp. Wu6 TaxID=3107928 RepID=UPI002DD6584C|nr:hypothetical protein [Methylomicrobium sp. Wu6]MEC4748933.1 hypothetical protein [Methylomicrobium sp. Wu6]
MMKATLPNRIKPPSLTAQIRDAELRVLKRQRGVGVRTDMLVQKIHQQMSAPATLLLAAGIGYILGEITQRQSPKFRGDVAAGTTPLRSALNLMTSVQTFYRALPLVWLMKSFRQPGARSQAPERQFPPGAERFPVQQTAGPPKNSQNNSALKC